MKNSSQLLKLGLVMLCGLCAPVALYAQTRDTPLVLSAQADKDSYLPGEAVQLTVSLSNQSGAPIKVGEPDPENGTLSLFLAFGEQRFQRYTGPDWNQRGELAKPETELGEREAHTVQTTLLYHRLQATSHLTEMYAHPIREADLNSYFALNSSGRYLLKAAFYDCVSKTTIESEPLTIIVREPEGVDGLVWDQIKGDAAAALFLHTGKHKQQSDTLESRESRERIQQLLTIYPETIYARRIQALNTLDQSEK